MTNENITQIISKLEKEIKHLFHSESSGHDIWHLKRVLNSALHIQEKEGGDRLVVAIAAFLHDIHRIIQHETGEFCSPENSLSKIEEILGTVDLQPDKVEKILHVIKYHEEYDFTKEGKTVSDIETFIVQDADNLDGLGAIGIGRSFAYGSRYKVPMWDPDIPLNKGEYVGENQNDPSTIHHFHAKMFNLKDNMNTKTAKEIAKQRHEFSKDFVKEFLNEWEGKN